MLSLPAVTTRLYAADEIQYFAYLRSLWFDQDLSFENEYQYFYDRGIARAHGFHETFLELRTATGLRYNFGTIGSALLWAPFYAVGDLTARGMSLVGSDVAVDGFSQPYLSAVTYGSAVYGFLAIAISMAVVRRLVDRGFVAGLVIWTGTPLLFYTHIAPGMAHACSAFAVAVFVVVWLRVRRSWSLQGIAALGAATALMAMVREQDLLLAIGPVVDFTWTAIAKVRASSDRIGAARSWFTAASVGSGVCASVYAPQAMSYIVLNGRLGPPDVITGKLRLAGAPRPAGAVLTGAWPVRVDAALAGCGRWAAVDGVAGARRISRHAADWTDPVSDGDDTDLRDRKRRFLDLGRGVRPAPFRGVDHRLGRRPGGGVPGGSRRRYPPSALGGVHALGLVEPRADGAVWRQSHGSTAFAAIAQRL